MRIAQICPLWLAVPPELYGGTERIVFDLTEALVGLGHDVTLFAADGSRTSAKLQPQGPPISTVPNAPPSLPSAAECVMLDRVARRADQFDIIHCHTEFYHAAVLAPWKDKLAMTIHWRADEADRQTFFDHFGELPVIAISRLQASMLPDGNVAGVVHHGIDPDRYAFVAEPDGYLAFIGRMTDQKGPDRAIEIARRAGMPIRLAGDVDIGNPTYFRDRVEPQLGGSVDYVGGIDDAAKRSFLGKADAVIFPIEWPEPFGLVLIEAMACGTPVIAFDHGATAEIIEHGVTGFVVADEAEAAATVPAARALDRAAIRQRFDERFSRARMAADYVAIYERIAAARPR